MEVKRHDLPVIASEFQVINKSGVTRTKREGTVMKEVAVACFNPSANTSQRTTASHGLGVYIPTKAIITDAWIDVVTTFTDGDTDAATIALTLQSAGDLVAAIAIADASNVWDAGIRGTLINNPNLGNDAAHDTALEVIALHAATKLKLTAVREVVATVAIAALTAGKANIYIEYFISD